VIWRKRPAKNKVAPDRGSIAAARERSGLRRNTAAGTKTLDIASPDVDKSNGFAANFARTTVPPQMVDPHKREKWGLPPLGMPDNIGPYIVELDVSHKSGLAGAEADFWTLYNAVVAPERAANKDRRAPLKLTKSYFRCDLSDNDWFELIAKDQQMPKERRAIYRLWPDFTLQAHTDHSIATIKADAAMRSFDASGEGIVWAVIDSGIDGNHPHFGQRETAETEAAHLLYAKEVVGLHRCFAEIDPSDAGGMDTIVLGDPDDASLPAVEREKLLDQHLKKALTDDFGHGTHVAGIISGRAPESSRRVVFEKCYEMDDNNKKVSQSYGVRKIINKSSDSLGTALHGVAPNTKLISLRVLDKKGRGRASQLIQALEYIREKLNDNPKLMRVHGVNLSVGYEFDAEMFACGQSPLCTAVDRLVQEGVVVVTAAGNTGFGTVAASVGSSKVGLSNTINDPGNAALAITVGATHRDSPHTYGVSYFSSKGPTADGRLKPDLVAPGERITSCAAGSKLSAAAVQATGDTANADHMAYYVDDSGTSMAAPHVSGAVAAFLSIRREFIGKPLEVKRIFLESATTLGRERYFEGHGMLDLMRAIQSV
jgi:subtilisin family serine protease